MTGVLPSRQRGRDVRVGHRIEPQLDQIGARQGSGVAAPAQLRRRGCGRDDDEKWSGHKKSLFNRYG